MSKVYVITGATSGIGRIAAEAIARTGATVVFNARDLQKGERVRQEIISATQNPDVHCLEGDFASLRSVQQFGRQIAERYPVIHVLVNNAGTWEMTFGESADGIELNLAVNHLAPFLLTQLLLDGLKAAPAARIINTSSMAHRRNILQWEDLEFRQGLYNGWFSYSQSKLCNLLFSKGLEKRLAASGADHVTVNSLHPGLVRTALFDQMSAEQLAGFGQFVTPEVGAQTTIFLALSPQVEGVSGQYWSNAMPATATTMATDPVLAERLWQVSEAYIHQAIGQI